MHAATCTAGGVTLGWQFDDAEPVVSASPTNIWTIRMAAQELLRLGSATGAEIATLVGMYTSRTLIRRELLSVCSATYAFAERYRLQRRRQPLWTNVRRELEMMSALIVLARRDLAAPYSDTVTCFDASWWGLGVMAKDVDRDTVHHLATYNNERWRFSKEEEVGSLGPRAADLIDDVPDSTVVPSVPRSVWGGRWKRLCSKAWKDADVPPPGHTRGPRVCLGRQTSHPAP